MQNINWPQLFKQGRVKAIGVPWSEEDDEALSRGMSVEDVRNGILRPEDKEEKEAKMTPLEKMLKAELVELAKEKGISFEEDMVTKADLVHLIKTK